MKGIVLTFDDGLASNFNFVRPLLKSINAKATFFICGKNPWNPEHPLYEEGMTLEQLKILEQDGFELGNHTFSHIDLKRCHPNLVYREAGLLKDKFEQSDLKRARTFCYPGYHASLEVSDIIRSLGYTHARTGYIYDDHESQHSKEVDRPPVSYHPRDSENNQLIKSTGIVNFIYGFDEFKKDVENCPKDNFCIFTFHGFNDDRLKENFIKIVDYIKENKIKTFNFNEID